MHKISIRLVKMMKAVELAIAVLLMVAIAISTLATVCFGMESLMNQSFQLDAILGKALILAVGVGFVEMLVLHTPEPVIEVLLYTAVRQIIISHESAIENLVGVLVVALTFVVKKYFLMNAEQKRRQHKNLW